MRLTSRRAALLHPRSRCPSVDNDQHVPASTPADDPVELEVWQQLFAMYQLPAGSAPHKLVRPFDICLRDPGSSAIRKITKIIPYADGGFAMLAPQHHQMEGLAVKHKRDYDKAVWSTPWSETVKYSASDRVKLSLHPDGFTQFSGENPGRILSGRDAGTGEPKGLGVISNPFTSPVYTGPTFAILFWGLQGYPIWKHRERQNLVLFEPQEVYFDEPGLDAYAIEGFLFTPWFLPHIRVDRKEASARRMTLPLWRYHIRGSRLWHFTVLPGVGAPLVIVTLRVSRQRVPTTAPSGYVLHGPAERGPGRVRWLLSAFYPPPSANVIPDASLDYLSSERRS